MEAKSPKKFKYYDLIMAAFVTILLCSNIIGAEKVVSIAGFSFGAGILFFPLSYFFNDILTEVYGYARSRKVVWAGFRGYGFCIFHVMGGCDFATGAGVDSSECL